MSIVLTVRSTSILLVPHSKVSEEALIPAKCGQFPTNMAARRALPWLHGPWKKYCTLPPISSNCASFLDDENVRF